MFGCKGIIRSNMLKNDDEWCIVTIFIIILQQLHFLVWVEIGKECLPNAIWNDFSFWWTQNKQYLSCNIRLFGRSEGYREVELQEHNASK